MTANISYEAQRAIYLLLSNDMTIRSSVDKIYLFATCDAKYPFILVNMTKVICVNSIQKTYEIDFQIIIFSKLREYHTLPQIGEKVTKILAINNLKFDGFTTMGLSSKAVELERASDFVSCKLTMNFNCLIKTINL